MKKVFAIVMTLVMLLGMSVMAHADEVVFEEEVLFLHAGQFNHIELTVSYDDFMAALATPGAEMRITRSAPTDVVYPSEGAYEKFCMTDTWWAITTPLTEGTDNLLKLGTGQHTIAESTVQSGNPYDVNIDCLWDDGTVVAYDAQAILDAFNTWMPESHGPNLVLASNTSTESYDVIAISIVVPDEPYVAPEVEAPAEEPAPETEAPETEAPAEDTPAEEAPAETGVALALLPAAVALAVVAFKKR